MKDLNPQVLNTAYGQLVARYVTALLKSGAPGEVHEYVSTAESLAECTVLALQTRQDQLDAAEAQRIAQLRAEREARPKLPVVWFPSPDDERSRSGAHWSEEEREALLAQYSNGQGIRRIASYHRRTVGAVLAQLVGLQLLKTDGDSHWDAETDQPVEM